MSRILTADEEKLLSILQEHKGRKNAIKGRRLAYKIFGKVSDESLPTAQGRYPYYERKLRALVHDLIFDHGVPVIADAAGYYLVERIEEMESATTLLRKHAISELVKAAMLRKVAPAELIGQLTFEFPAGESPVTGMEEDDGPKAPRLPAHLTAITTILGEYQKDPQKYAEEIRQVQEKFSPLFISREDVSAIEQTMATLDRIKKRIM